MKKQSRDNRELIEVLAALIFQHDPLSLRHGADVPADEYEPEARAIAARLLHCADQNACRNLVWNVFREQFGDETIGPPAAFAALASDIWTRFR